MFWKQSSRNLTLLNNPIHRLRIGSDCCKVVVACWLVQITLPVLFSADTTTFHFCLTGLFFRSLLHPPKTPEEELLRIAGCRCKIIHATRANSVIGLKEMFWICTAVRWRSCHRGVIACCAYWAPSEAHHLVRHHGSIRLQLLWLRGDVFHEYLYRDVHEYTFWHQAGQRLAGLAVQWSESVTFVAPYFNKRLLSTVCSVVRPSCAWRTLYHCVQWHDGNCYVFVDEGDLEFRCRSVCGLLHRCRLVILLLCHRCHSATITTSSDSVLSSAFWNQLKVRLGPSKVSQWRTAEHYWS